MERYEKRAGVLERCYPYTGPIDLSVYLCWKLPWQLLRHVTKVIIHTSFSHTHISGLAVLLLGPHVVVKSPVPHQNR